MRHGLMAMLFSAHNDVAIQNRNSRIGRRASKLQSADVVVSRESKVMTLIFIQEVVA